MKNNKLRKSEHLVVRITPQQLTLIVDYIKEEKGTTISDFIRKSINSMLRK